MAVGHNGTDALMDVKTVAERLNVSAGTVYELCQSGRLTHRRIGRTAGRGAYRIAEEDLASFMEESVVGEDTLVDGNLTLRHLEL